MSEKFLTLSEAAQRLPNRPAVCSIWRWCSIGLRAKNGQRVVLRSVRFGRSLFIPEGALAEFGEALGRAMSDGYVKREEAAIP